MKFKEIFKSFLKKDNDYWLNIYNIYVNIRAGALLIIGFLWSTINSITNRYEINFLRLNRGSFFSWLISIIISIVITFVSTIISKVILSFLSDIKKIRDK